jgi:DNA-binding transcriptional ArsR family regulator
MLTNAANRRRTQQELRFFLRVSAPYQRILPSIGPLQCIGNLSIDLIKEMVYNTGMDTFSAIAEPTRRSILEMLAREGRLSASEIYERFPVSAPAISQHLKALREAKLVRVEKRGQQRIYRLNPDAMLELEQWTQKVRDLWDEQFEALDRVLEAEKKKKALAEQEPAPEAANDMCPLQEPLKS